MISVWSTCKAYLKPSAQAMDLEILKTNWLCLSPVPIFLNIVSATYSGAHLWKSLSSNIRAIRSFFNFVMRLTIIDNFAPCTPTWQTCESVFIVCNLNLVTDVFTLFK